MTKSSAPKTAKAKKPKALRDKKGRTLEQLEKARIELGKKLSTAEVAWEAFLRARAMETPCGGCGGRGVINCGSLGTHDCGQCQGSGTSFEAPAVQDPPAIRVLRQEHTDSLHAIWEHPEQVARRSAGTFGDEYVGDFFGGDTIAVGELDGMFGASARDFD